jgi:selenocysteine-specific translation elongation factor
MNDVSIIPREGEWVEIPETAPERTKNITHYRVYRVDHAYNIQGAGVAVIMAFCRPEQRSE